MRWLALATLMGLGCTSTMGVRTGRAAGPRGGEGSLLVGIGMARPDSLGMVWVSEMGFATAKHQESGAFMMRSGLDVLAAMTSSRLIVRGGPTFGARVASLGEAMYSQYGLHATVVPLFWRARQGADAPQIGVGFYAAVDRLFGGQRTIEATHTSEDVEGQTIFTVGVALEVIAVDMFSAR